MHLHKSIHLPQIYLRNHYDIDIFRAITDNFIIDLVANLKSIF
jgi:hypothetical protein